MNTATAPAPSVTMADINANIIHEYFFTAHEGVFGTFWDGGAGVADVVSRHPSLSLLTFCVLVLKNGFTVTGESACVSPENFDRDKGRKIAREHALSKIWPLMGYELKCRLDRGEVTGQGV